MPAQQLPCFHLQRPGQLFDHSNRRVPAPALDVANVSTVDTGAVGIVFLAPASGFAEFAYIAAKAGAYIHAGLKTPLSPINLQTISHIDVDFAHNGSLVSLMIDTAPTVPLRAERATLADLQPVMLT